MIPSVSFPSVPSHSYFPSRSSSARRVQQPAADPLEPILGLSGVAEAVSDVRASLAALHRHRANLKNWATTSAEANLRGARASAALSGGDINLPSDGTVTDPSLAGALRLAGLLSRDSIDKTSRQWRRAPLQVLAQAHTLAASDLVSSRDLLGHPREDDNVSMRLTLLADLITGGTRVPSPVLIAIVHGEIMALRPFGIADDMVARFAARITAVTTGLDPHNLGVPEVFWYRHVARYRRLAHEFALGTPAAIRNWVLLSCEAHNAGASEGRSIAEMVG